MIQAWFDGIVAPTNPGNGACAVHIEREGEIIASHGDYLGADLTNNEAEYAGFIAILEILKQCGLTQEPILIRGDNLMVIQQMFYRWRIKKGKYKEKAEQAKKLLKAFPNAQGEWIPREENTLCDEMAEEALNSVIAL